MSLEGPGKLSIRDIRGYKNLYAVYDKLNKMGDKTKSAANAKKVFGQDIDHDKDGIAELWELMQCANNVRKEIIFLYVDELKKEKFNEYKNISADNPAHILLEMERDIVGDDKVRNAYEIINYLIGEVKKAVRKDMDPLEKLKVVHKILKKKLAFSYERANLVSEALSGDPVQYDCDIGAALYMIIAHEMKWPLYFALAPVIKHAFLRWRLNEKEYLNFETTTGGTRRDPSGGVIENKAGMFAVAHSMKAIFYTNKGLNERALKEINFTLSLSPYTTSFIVQKGNILARLKRFPEAFKAYEQAIKYNDKNSDIYYNFGQALIDSKNYMKAIEVLKLVFEYGGKDVVVYMKIAKAYEELGKNEEAIEYTVEFLDKSNMYREKISKDEYFKRRGQAYHMRGEILMKLKRYKEAAKGFYDALLYLGEKGDLYFYKGEAEYMYGNYRQAIKDFSRAIELGYKEREIFKYRGNAYEKINNQELAKQDLQKYNSLKE